MSFPRDLIVVGSGITGLSAAIFYKRRNPDASVMVLDRGFWPHGATARNAGFACFGSAGELTDDLINESETEVKNRLEKRFNGLELLKSELGNEHIDYNMCGGYELFGDFDEKHFQDSVVNIPLFNEWVQAFTGESESYKIEELNGFKVIYNRLEGYLHSGKLVRRLLEKASNEGVEIRWNTPVREVTEGNVIFEDDLALPCTNVLIATNGFTKNLLPDCEIEPARGYVFVTSPIESLKWRGCFHYNKGYVYFRDLGDRLLLGGARDVDIEGERSFENEINHKIKNWLIDFAREKLLPGSDWEIHNEWTGIMGFGPSKSPICQKINDHVYLAAGLGGMGVALGMELGRSASEMIA